MTDDIKKDKNKAERNRRRRKRRLEKHTGVDWIDPEDGYGAVRGERALWRAVIVQMLEDAASQSAKDHDKYNKEMARNWLESNSQDFYMVCDLAGFDVGYLRTNIKKALLNNCKWRAESKPRKKIQKKTQKTPRPIEKKTSETEMPNHNVIPLHDFQKKTA